MTVGIVGAAGYSGEVLVERLAAHPRVRLELVTSRQHAGKPVAEVLPRLRGRLTGLRFAAAGPEEVAAAGLDLVFLALPHGAAATYARPLVAAGVRTIDLSADFRLSDPARYEAFYGSAHPAPELLAEARFVLPELTPPDWRGATLIAAPGCYPTSILVPLGPLYAAGLLPPRGVVINSYSGVSGAGKKAEELYLYCERSGSLRPYGIPRHRHLSEIEEQLSALAGAEVVVQFSPHLAPVPRGIMTTIVAPAPDGADAGPVREAWERAYGGRPFVGLLPQGVFPDSRHVVGTNRVDLAVTHDPRTGNLVINATLDNLLKGASGQAIQIMNLWHGFEETEGLLP
ncbi:MAG: N-acetyl-gamma-glutamyl-phosphate reductase [Puniceicoccaceae bacterium]|nr:MAG: N-acetyl-gamma-glutamyl-phosphate reductase [Puniceicoccaceae bacterium]